MVERRAPLTVGEIDGGAGRDEHAEDGHVARPAIAQDHGLEEGRPSEVVDVVERRPSFDQDPDHVHMTEMRRGDEGGAVVGLVTFPGRVPSARANSSVATSSRTAAMVTTS